MPSHDFVKFTNSCVQPGRAATELNDNEHGLDNMSPDNGAAELFTRTSITDLENERDQLTDEEFYDRLLRLREEQRDTLKHLESLYAAKLPKENKQFQSEHIGSSESVGNAERLEYLAAENYRLQEKKLAEIENRYQDLVLEDADQTENQNGYDMYGNRETTRQQKPSYSENDVSAANMWDNFNMVEYLAELNDEHDRNLEKINQTIKKHKTSRENERPSENWRPNITVPKPFNMTMREYQKPNKKSRSQQIFEEEERQRKEKEAQEVTRKFRANPVPCHTYLPLYTEMQEKEKAYRNHNREMRKLELESMKKPFKFDERERDREKLNEIEKKIDLEDSQMPPKVPKFKAKKVPDHIYDPRTITDKLQEEELYRQVRCKVRSEELLRHSKLPSTMQQPQNKFRMSKMKDVIHDPKSDFMKSKNPGVTHKPKINHEIPDFDVKYKKFLESVQKSRKEPEATVCKPFKLRTEMISRVSAQANPREGSRAKSASAPKASQGVPKKRNKSATVINSDTIPPKATKSYDLMKSKNEEKLLSQIQRERQKEEERHARKQREAALRKSIAVKAAANDQSQSLEQSRAAKLAEFRAAQREMEQEYSRKLAEMTNRVEQRELLFERQAEAAAKKEAEKRYIQTLRSVGLDDDTVSGLSGTVSGTAGAGYGYRDPMSDSYDDDFNYSDIDVQPDTP